MDCLELNVLLPRIKDKKLPNFEKLINRGYYGIIDTFVPTSSPIIWTSIATGKKKEKHGIVDFSYINKKGKVALFNNSERKAKALWNILSDYGKSTWVIGWWMTYPVEEINGVMVAQTNTVSQLDTKRGKNIWKGNLIEGVEGQVYPKDKQNEMIAILKGVDSQMNELTKSIFGEFKYPLSVLGKNLWSNCLWAFRADETYRRIIHKLISEKNIPDLTLIYFGGSDVVSHRFWRYMRPEIYENPPSMEETSNFREIISNYYIYYDKILGELLEEYGKDTNVFVMSDHGMHAFNTEGVFNPDDPPENVSSGNHQDGPPAVFIAAGPEIAEMKNKIGTKDLTKDDIPETGTVFDITPTILSMLRIPLGSDMDGKPLCGLFRKEFQLEDQPSALDSQDNDEFIKSRNEFFRKTAPGEEERIKQLRSLGYIN